jgi:hypothetical protein
MARIFELGLGRKVPEDRASVTELQLRVAQGARELADFALESAAFTEPGKPSLSFLVFERELMVRVLGFARVIASLFLARVEELVVEHLPPREERAGRLFRRCPPQCRALNTLFGVLWYWRTYMREVSDSPGRNGYHPTDAAVGLAQDRLSFGLIGLVVRLATKLSFAEARDTIGLFIPTPPSTEVIEKAVMGLGRYTEEFFAQAPAPADDGEVLVVMFDSKGIPTATEHELERRKGKRKPTDAVRSKRHRGRAKRSRYPRPKPRKKGDKSKNARMATAVVMYTLRRKDDLLVGPLNVWRYVSMAPKRHAFAIARREADKRGFAQGTGKLVQVVVDGDEDLERYAKERFPEAILTIDIMHVLGYIYKAGTAFLPEASDELMEWYRLQADYLYNGEAETVLHGLAERLAKIPKRGPGNKGRRERISAAITYMTKRLSYLNYGELVDQDLEVGSGMVEGTVKYVIARRFDHGGMRWIRERAEPLLQLRCIEVNGQWDDFIVYVHAALREEAAKTGPPTRLQQAHPNPLPKAHLEAA